MKMKLAFSLVLSLILLISVSSVILLIDTSSPVLAQEDNGDHGGNGDYGGDDGGDEGGDDGDYGDEGGHGDEGEDGDYGDEGGHGDEGEDGDGHPGGGEDVGGFSGEAEHELIQQDLYPDDIEALMHMEPPEGQEYGDVQNIRDFNGDIIVTADGVPVLGRQVFDKNTGEPVLDYSEYREGEPIYIVTWGEISPPMTYFLELGPGFRSGPGYERFKYTPPPGFDPRTNPENQDGQTQETPSPAQISESENQDGQTQETPSPAQISESENEDDQIQVTLPLAPIPEPRNQDGELPPSEAFDDDTQFGEPQPVMDPTGNPLVNEGGVPVLGRVALDEEGKPVIGPNGKPIIVIPD